MAAVPATIDEMIVVPDDSGNNVTFVRFHGQGGEPKTQLLECGPDDASYNHIKDCLTAGPVAADWDFDLP